MRFHEIHSKTNIFLTFLPVAIFVLSSPTYRKDFIREAVYTLSRPSSNFKILVGVLTLVYAQGTVSMAISHGDHDFDLTSLL